MSMIHEAGNTTDPAILVLLQKGYELHMEGLAVEEADPLYVAVKDGIELSAFSPLALLGIIGIWEARGEDWQVRSEEKDIIDRFWDAVMNPPEPESAEDFFDRGLERHEWGDHAGAVTDLDEAIRLEPRLAEAYYYRAEAKQLVGDGEGAVLDYAAAIRLAPEQFTEIEFCICEVTDEMLANLEGSPYITFLDLSLTKITDATLASL